jgi:hypothetical protein
MTLARFQSTFWNETLRLMLNGSKVDAGQSNTHPNNSNWTRKSVLVGAKYEAAPVSYQMGMSLPNFLRTCHRNAQKR